MKASTRPSARPQPTPGLLYRRAFVSKKDREEILAWLSGVYPIWEERYSANNPPPEGEKQRQLLRPVYWLGNWQFACLNYYHPPQGILHRCVKAEPFPPVLARMVKQIEALTKKMFSAKDLPKKWKLNTCLLNFYGSRIDDGRKIDTARVGDHKDFEPGPVASVSLGERAMFQFVSSPRPGARGDVILEQWLDDGSLQIFGSHRWKSQYFHRVQRVDTRGGFHFPINVENFETRRLNFTFRYVPDEHIWPYGALPAKLKDDVRVYMRTLAEHSKFFADELKRGGGW